jgi:hypothetical protein
MSTFVTLLDSEILHIMNLLVLWCRKLNPGKDIPRRNAVLTSRVPERPDSLASGKRPDSSK